MRLLLDTHALIWWFLDDPALSRPAYAAIVDTANAVCISAASAMEITTKCRLGKLPEAASLAPDFEAAIASQGFTELPISVSHARRAGELAIPHKDPFDRLLIAQAQAEDLTLVSNEAMFDHFAVRRLW